MNREHPIQLEVVCFDLRGAMAAAAGGADRIELCANPGDGGTTPSHGLISYVKDRLSVPAMVMIRPRGGDFLYTAEETEIMRRDILLCKSIGVQGVVFGVLDEKGNVNSTLCRELVQLAAPMECTFHRAFDMVSYPMEALEEIITCGFHRILTSGGTQRAIDGAAQLKSLVKQAGNRITILPGGGVDESCIGQLVQQTGLNEFHISARKHEPSGMTYHNPGVKMGTGGSDEFQLLTVDPLRIHTIRQLAENAIV